MRDSIDPTSPTRPRHARTLAAIALVTLVLTGGCGGASGNKTASSPDPTSAGTTSPGTTSPGSPARRASPSGPLAFAECMRAHGVPNFPDPSPGRGSLFDTTGVDASAPAFRAAQARCRRLMGGGPPGPGSTTHPSARTLEKLVRIASCMRAHHVPQFPDPRTSVPANPVGYQEITDFDGAILLFPASMNLQAPAYRQALAACGAPPLGLPH